MYFLIFPKLGLENSVNNLKKNEPIPSVLITFRIAKFRFMKTVTENNRKREKTSKTCLKVSIQ